MSDYYQQQRVEVYEAAVMDENEEACLQPNDRGSDQDDPKIQQVLEQMEKVQLEDVDTQIQYEEGLGGWNCLGLVIHELAPFLSGRDLAALSAVNHAWRDWLNQDKLWKPHCNPHTTKYLQENQPQVEPKFVSPANPDSGLSDICEMRLAFMRQTHLWNNWRKGNYVRRVIPSSDMYYVWAYFENDSVVKINIDDLEVWDLKEKPRVIQEVGVEWSGRGIKLSGDIIILEENGTVMVIQSDSITKETNYLKSFKITGQELDVISEHFCIFADKIVHICGDFHTLRVWNVQSGKKIKELERPDIMFEQLHEKSSLDESYLCVSASIIPAIKTVLIYDREFNKIFQTKFYIVGIMQAFTSKDLAFVHLFSAAIDCYNLKTGQLVASLFFPVMPAFYLNNVSASVMFSGRHEDYLSIVAGMGKDEKYKGVCPLDGKYFLCIDLKDKPYLTEWKNGQVFAHKFLENRDIKIFRESMVNHTFTNRSFTKFFCQNGKNMEIFTWW